MSNVITDMNERASEYFKNGATIGDAIKLAVSDFVVSLFRVGYRILSEDEISSNKGSKFFEEM